MIRVTVTIADGIADDIQAKCLFDFERSLRAAAKADVRVFKERMADDSRLRVVMDARRKK